MNLYIGMKVVSCKQSLTEKYEDPFFFANRTQLQDYMNASESSKTSV